MTKFFRPGRFRTLGSALILIGVLIALSYFIEPLKEAFSWYWLLPVPLQIGFGIAGIGLTVVIISLLIERWSDRDADRALRED